MKIPIPWDSAKKVLHHEIVLPPIFIVFGLSMLLGFSIVFYVMLAPTLDPIIEYGLDHYFNTEIVTGASGQDPAIVVEDFLARPKPSKFIDSATSSIMKFLRKQDFIAASPNRGRETLPARFVLIITMLIIVVAWVSPDSKENKAMADIFSSGTAKDFMLGLGMFVGILLAVILALPSQ